MFVLVFVCSSILSLCLYNISNKYIFIVYIHTVVGFVNILASGNHDAHYNRHLETPPPPLPKTKRMYIQSYPNTTSDATNNMFDHFFNTLCSKGLIKLTYHKIGVHVELYMSDLNPRSPSLFHDFNVFKECLIMCYNKQTVLYLH